MTIDLSTFIGMTVVPFITAGITATKVMFLISMIISAFILKYDLRIKAEKAARKATWAFQDVAEAQAQASAKYADMHFSEHEIKRLAKLLFLDGLSPPVPIQH
jgi:mannitol-specific phosphotransferase system IIBC component